MQPADQWVQTCLNSSLIASNHRQTGGDLLFNEWMDGTQHCISHFFKIDVFYWSTDAFRPSPWLKFPAAIVLDRTGIVSSILKESASLQFLAVPVAEVSRLLSKALAGRTKLSGESAGANCSSPSRCSRSLVCASRSLGAQGSRCRIELRALRSDLATASHDGPRPLARE